MLAAAVLVASACGGGQVDTREVERSLVDGFVPDGAARVEGADCPNQVDRGAGGSFVCTVQIGSQELSVRVVQVDDDGTVRFEQLQTVLDAGEVADDVARQVGRELGQLVTATCGDDPFLVVDEDEPFECDVVDGHGSVLVVRARFDGDGVLTVEPV